MVQKICLLGLFSFLLISCGKADSKKNEDRISQAAVGFPEPYAAVGEEFSAEAILDTWQMSEEYEQMQAGDSLQIRFRTTVNSVCKKKGCWLKVALGDGSEAMVKFKDYAFFVPKDIENREVVVNGIAFVDEMSVEDQRHFAEDAGKSPGEVAAITTPKKTFSFLAEGVVIKNK